MEKESNKSIAALMRSTRKFHSLQQTEFAAILGVTQGTISKIEAASMSPELGLWFKFLRSFQIQDPYCFTYFGLDFDEKSFSKLQTEGSTLAPVFDFSKKDYLFTVKTLRPLFDFALKNHTKNFEAFLKEQKISKEIFYILNHPLTSDITYKFFNFLEDNKINSKSVAMLELNFDYALGRCMQEISSSDSTEDLFKILNTSADNGMIYEYSGKKGEYFVELKSTTLAHLSDLQKSELMMNYLILFPYHLLKSTKNLKMSPKIEVVKKDSRWHVTFA